MKLYITAISVFVLIIFYVPIVIWLWRKIIKMPITITKKIALSVLFFIVAYLIPLGDVTYNSFAMAKVCPTAGLHIYKTVEVDGYLGLASKEDLKRYSYRFMEGIAPGGEVVRYEKNSDDVIITRVIPQPTAEYEVLTPNGYAKSNGFELSGYSKKTHTETSRWVIRNKITNEILAEWLFFSALPGWLDRILVYRWFGYGGSALSCTSHSDFSVWPQTILFPKNLQNDREDLTE